MALIAIGIGWGLGGVALQSSAGRAGSVLSSLRVEVLGTRVPQPPAGNAYVLAIELDLIFVNYIV